MSEKRPPFRVLYYVVNGLGMGHLVRCLSFHFEMQKQCKENYQPMFLSSSDASYLLDRFRIRYSKLPAKGSFSNLGLSYRKTAGALESSVLGLFNAFDPHMVLVDTLNAGSFNELSMIRKGSKAFWVWINRARRKDSYSEIELKMVNRYHLILNPHYKGEEDAMPPVKVRRPVYWSGPVFLDHKQIKSDTSVQEDGSLPVVLLMQGGGGDKKSMEYRNTIRQALHDVKACRVVEATGPLSEKKASSKFSKEFMVLEKNHFPLFDWYKRAAFAVSAAGYNSFHELHHHKVPAIYIPQNRGLDDQEARALRSVKQGSGFICYSAAGLYESLRGKLNLLINDTKLRKAMAKKAGQLVPKNHAGEAVREILSAYRKKAHS